MNTSELLETTKSDDAARRVKKWAPKVRTGCTTCRTRRIKCDETKPVCKKCLTYGRTCGGSGYFAQGGARPVVTVLDNNEPKSKSEHGTSLQEQNVSPPQVWLQLWRGKSEATTLVPELLPAEWHFLECLAFYNTVVLEFVKTSQAIPSGFNEPYHAKSAEPMMDTIVAFTLAVRIATVSRAYGNRLQPSEAYNTAHLWSHLYRRVENTLKKINHDIKYRPFDVLSTILQNIAGIKSVEVGRFRLFALPLPQVICAAMRLTHGKLMLQSPGWRPHMEGFLALLKYYGGPQVVLTRYGIGYAPNDCVVESIIANTVGPPNNQITGVSAFSMEDIIFLYSHMSHPSLPCPTKLFKEIININQLRVSVYSGALSSADIRLRAVKIFDRINEFAPEHWTESYFLPDIPEVALLASIFKSAVGLFGRLALPVEKVWPISFVLKDKTARRDSLLQLIITAFKSENCRTALNWPLAVLGCALARSRPEDQALVGKFLVDAAIDPNSTQPLTIRAKLQRFWASGTTRWDECWREPFVVIG